MKEWLLKYYKETLGCLFFLGISLYYAIGNDHFPTMDGASHMHNAYLLKDYFLGNEVVKQNYELNSFIIPNIFSSYLLMSLLFFFNSAISIFIFQLIHYLLFFLSFLYFFKAYKVKYSYLLSIVAVLFFNSFLFNLGFYNFSFSVIFLIFSIAFYFKNFSELSTKGLTVYSVLLGLLALLYYSNALSFLVFVTYVGIKELNKVFRMIKTKEQEMRRVLTEQFKLSLIFLPFLVLLFAFHSSFTFQSLPLFSNPIKDYLEAILDLKPFIVYVYLSERNLVKWIGYALVVLILYTIIIQFKYRTSFVTKDLGLLTLSIIVLVLYLIVPDNSSVGMMSPRFLYFFFVFLILWLFIQSTDLVKLPVAIIIIIVVFFERDRKHMPVINLLNKDVELVKDVAQHIKPNSVVLTLNYHNNWLEPNFSNYLGTDKPLILLANYEATVGWFPIKWNLKQMPKYLLGNSEQLDGAYYCINPSGEPKIIDYVFVFGDRSQINSNTALNDLLAKYYQKVITAENGLCTLYYKKEELSQ